MALLPLTNLTLDAIHVEVGGSTGTTVSLNDADIRALTHVDEDYNEGSSGLGSSGEFIAMGELRNGFENFLNPNGTWILEGASSISALENEITSSEWTYYVSEFEEHTNNGLATAQSSATLTVKDTSTNLEIWLDEDDRDYQSARLLNNTIIDPGDNAYKIWSYPISTGGQQFTAKLDYTSVHSGDASNNGLETTNVTLTSTAQSLSQNRGLKFFHEASEQFQVSGNNYKTSEYYINCTVTFEMWGYEITKSFRIWLRAHVRSWDNQSCFDAGTMVQMANGTEKAISLIELGDMTKGGRVFGTHKFFGGPNGYNYNGVILSGTHWVVENGRVMDVKDSVLAKKVSYVPDYWYSLTTEDNRIWANDVEFYDEGCMDFTSLNKYAQALINKDEEEIKKWAKNPIELSHSLEERYLGISHDEE